VPFNSPPNFDLVQFAHTVQRLMVLYPTALYYSHFGASNNVLRNLKMVMDTVLAWDDIAIGAMKNNRPDSAAKEIEAQFQPEMERVRNNRPLYQFIEDNLPVSAAAYIKYHQDK
ncbi:hypothetical protein ACFLYE_05040, partial [Chloroflexota bacterium]